MNELVSIQEIYDIIHECSNHRCSKCVFYSDNNCLFDEDIEIDVIVIAFSKFKNAQLEGSESPCL